MTHENDLAGVTTPVLTPFGDDGRPAHDLYVDHCKSLLADGGHLLAPFGTTGEAVSLTIAERMDALEALVDGGVPAGRLMPGTGLCARADSAALTAHAVSLGCRAVMVLPPFFYVTASDEGLFRYFAELIEEVAEPALRICLYHIPPMAGIGFSPALAARLNEAFPETVIGLKDSSGDFANTKATIAAAPDLCVLPGSETFLLEGLRAGGQGSISATCNVNVARIRTVYDMGRDDGADQDALQAANAAMIRVRKAFEAAGPIPAMKAAIAHRTGDPRWRNLRAPLLEADAEVGARLAAVIEAGDV